MRKAAEVNRLPQYVVEVCLAQREKSGCAKDYNDQRHGNPED
jgi:hypothetical protein